MDDPIPASRAPAPLPLFPWEPADGGPLRANGRRRVLHAVARRPSAGGFFEHRREWSRWKHFAEEGYLPMFGGVLGRDGGRVNWIDGFAGQGQYGDGAIGSPVIAARISCTLAARAGGRAVLR